APRSPGKPLRINPARRGLRLPAPLQEAPHTNLTKPADGSAPYANPHTERYRTSTECTDAPMHSFLCADHGLITSACITYQQRASGTAEGRPRVQMSLGGVLCRTFPAQEFGRFTCAPWSTWINLHRCHQVASHPARRRPDTVHDPPSSWRMETCSGEPGTHHPRGESTGHGLPSGRPRPAVGLLRPEPVSEPGKRPR